LTRQGNPERSFLRKRSGRQLGGRKIKKKRANTDKPKMRVGRESRGNDGTTYIEDEDEHRRRERGVLKRQACRHRKPRKDINYSSFTRKLRQGRGWTPWDFWGRQARVAKKGAQKAYLRKKLAKGEGQRVT